MTQTVQFPGGVHSPGFALVITLSLMVLLTVVALGLLSLSSIAMRHSSASADIAEAKANARLSLMLAIGDLQKEMGPDTRISVAADQLPKSATDGSDTASAAGRRHWTGVYDSWQSPAGSPSADPRPTPAFRRWLVSGSESDVGNLDFAKTAVGNSREMVGEGTLGQGNASGMVSVPSFEVEAGAKTTSRLAWWVGDRGMKAAVSTPQPEDPGANRALVRAGMQGAPRNAFQLAKAGGAAPFGAVPVDDSNLAKITGWKQTGLLASDPEATKPLFHDLVSNSSGLLINVRSGGFRKDLSMYLESTGPPTSGFPAPLVGTNGALYQVNGQDGIRIGELWSYYNLYKQLRTTGITFTTGGTASGSANPHLRAEGTLPTAQSDNFFYFKRPVIISYKALFSFYIRPDTTPRELVFVVDPVVTFWNPYDVPISLSPAYNSIRFLKIPYKIDNLKVTVDGSTNVVGTVKLGGVDSSSFGGKFASNYVTLRAGKAEPLVMRPGEVLVYAQPPRTLPQAADGSGGVTTVNGQRGYNFGGGVYYPVKNSSGQKVTIPPSALASQPVTIEFGGISPTADVITQGVANPSPVSVNHCETYLFEDRDSLGPFVGIGGAFVDFWRGEAPYTSAKSARFTANLKPSVFRSLAAGSLVIDAMATTTNDLKKPFLYYGYDAKTEEDSMRPGQFLSRLNPSAPLVDFAALSEAELNTVPFEIRIESNTSSALNSVIDQDPVTGRGFFGGGTTGAFGSTFVTTHSVPREPIVSIAALQHSMANGFTRDKPDTSGPSYGFSPLNTFSNQSIRMPMLPQISHAIGNSLAPAVLAMNQTEGSLSSNRALADHSYLANKALWDNWFFSGIAPQNLGLTSTGQSQKDFAESFLSGSSKLPAARYQPNLGSEPATSVLNRLFSATAPTAGATSLAASFLRVEGMFNVNSTSIEAWKAMLGSLRNHPIVQRTIDGLESTVPVDDNPNRITPVVGLLAPTAVAANDASVDVKDAPQWTGRRSLSDIEIESLAGKLVEEVRKRGPFLSMADFVNRRPGNDANLARAGAVQSAIDAANLNGGYGSRMAIPSPGIAFPSAESKSPAAQGIPGIIKQGDILTPIAPVLSARSDSFIIRGYGEKLDASGTKVLARAWCEAVVERGKDFVDPIDPPETALGSLTPVNQRFGRRFVILSFRWLHPDEI